MVKWAIEGEFVYWNFGGYDMSFSVEIKYGDDLKAGGSEVELFLDRRALDDLIKQLSFLRQIGDHAHFMTPAWGGYELTEDAYRPENTIAHHLKITLIDDEASIE